MDDLLNHAPCGFFSFGDDGVLSRLNATLLEMLGYGRDELAGRHVEQILTVGSRIFYQTHWFPLLRLHGRAEEIFLMLRSKDGEHIGVLANAVRRERQGVDAFDCIVMRVREREKFEGELLRARRAAEAAKAALEVQKRDLQQANEQLEAQAQALELQQQQLQEQAVELEAATEELSAANDALRARTQEAERMRAAAEEANQAKSRFLAVMSHELRTPLNAIGGYVELVEMGIHGPVTDAQREALRRISRSQSHLLRLINDVLDLARIEAGHVEYHVEEVPVDEVVAGVTPMLEPQFQEKGIHFEVELASGLVMRADRDKVQQILINLLSNAAKFTPQGGRVRLEAVPEPGAEGQLLLCVTDTGIGIAPEKLDSVFQPFVQVAPNSAGDGQGSGLGLAISRDMARAMEGDLTARSAPGEGSTFILRLPMGGVPAA